MFIYKNIITVDPGKRSGKPSIRGMRITVEDILRYLASEMTISTIIEDFSELTKNDILTAIEFAADRHSKIHAAA